MPDPVPPVDEPVKTYAHLLSLVRDYPALTIVETLDNRYNRRLSVALPATDTAPGWDRKLNRAAFKKLVREGYVAHPPRNEYVNGSLRSTTWLTRRPTGGVS